MSVSNAPSLQLAEYLEKLPGTTFRKLYQQPSTAFAIFRRMLPHLAKTIVMRMLFMPKPMLLDDLETWTKPEAKRQKDQTLSILQALHIVTISKERPQNVHLQTNFKNSMRRALTGGGDHNSFGVPSSLTIPAEVDIAFLDRYARKKWDDILHFVVSSVGFKNAVEAAGGPNKSVKELLIAGRLVDRGHGGAIGITQAGFTFLLQEANAQVWTLLLLWLEAMDASKAGEAVDMLSFLFVLASMELGRAYDTNALTEQRKNMLPSLVDFGLIHVPHHKRSMFFPTRLATTLTSGGSSSLRTISEGVSAATSAAFTPTPTGPLGASAEQKGSVVVETNYRIYAYTHSTLQIAVLALFCNLGMRFPDMVAGRLTRTSIRRAINYGITADQIIAYLAAHAHEQMHRTAALTNKPVLPPTVVDQIRLWQLENERMKTMSGFLFCDFENDKEFIDVAQFAEDAGVLVWRSDPKGMFFASKYEQIRDFMKHRKKGN